MGKPIKKSNFGPNTGTGTIIVDGVKYSDGTTESNVYIVSQQGDTAYIVQGATKSETVFLVNANSLTALLPGQCYILAIPYGGTAKPCGKITQYRVDLFDNPNTTPTQIGAITTSLTSYSWGKSDADTPGEVNLVGRPYTTVSPAITGTIAAGAGTLTVSAGTWTSSVSSYTFGITYQWYKNGAVIAGASNNSFVVSGAVSADKFTAVITASRLKSGVPDPYITGTASATYTVA